MIEYDDGQGAVIRFEFLDGKLIKSVNGTKKCGKDDFSGHVTKLKYEPERDRINDQYGWGGTIPKSLVQQLRSLAVRAGVDHNIA